MTPSSSSALAPTVLVDRFPSRSETFVMRQVQGLGASVTTFGLNGDLIPEMANQASIVSLGAAGLRQGRLTRLLATKFGAGPSHRMTAGAVERLTRQWAASPPSVVLAQFGPNGIRAAQVCPELGIPFVIHLHGYDATSLLRFRRYVDELRHALRAASAIVVVSEAMKETLLAVDRSSEDRVHVIPVGAPVAQFPPRSLGRQDMTFRFIAIGRLIEKKAPLSTVAAFARCRDQFTNVRLDVVGDGPLRTGLERLVESLRLEDAVTLHGAQPFERVRELLCGADCFVQHSVTGRDGAAEGWPTAIAEAMAAQLPVVSTRHAGIGDQVEEGVTGHLVDEHDIGSMAERMAALAAAPTRAAEMGRAGRRRIERVGDSSVALRKLGDLLDAVIEASSPPGQLDRRR